MGKKDMTRSKEQRVWNTINQITQLQIWCTRNSLWIVIASRDFFSRYRPPLKRSFLVYERYVHHPQTKISKSGKKVSSLLVKDSIIRKPFGWRGVKINYLNYYLYLTIFRLGLNFKNGGSRHKQCASGLFCIIKTRFARKRIRFLGLVRSFWSCRPH